MAAKTSTAAGDWNTGGTWTGGAKPVAGDTVTITHAVTVNGTEACGTSPVAGTVVLTINSPGSLTISGTLVVKGGLTANNALITVNGGGVLEFDASGAGSPSTATYPINIGTAAFQSAALIGNGTSWSSFATVRSNAGGANAYLPNVSAFDDAALIRATFTKFLRIGDATNNLASPLHTGGTFRMTDCICDGGGGVIFAQGGTDYTVDLARTTFQNTLAAIPLHTASTASITSGTRSIVHCVFDKQVQFYGPQDFTITDNVFYEGFDPTSNRWASWARNLCRTSSSGGVAPIGDMLDSYQLIDESVSGNPHFCNIVGDVGNCTFDGLIFEYTGTDDQGDCLLIPNPSGLSHYAAIRCITLPNSTGIAQSGTLMTGLSPGVLNTYSVEHCTYFGSGGAPSLSIEESNVGFAGQMKYLRSSIAWGPAIAQDALKVFDAFTPSGSQTPNLLNPANADYNCGWRIAAGQLKRGYDMKISGTVQPGTHDVDVNPQFVDSTRNLASWGGSLGLTATVAATLTKLLLMNDPTGAVVGCNPSALIAWVKAGFAPQNTALIGTAHDSSTIGAVQVAMPNTVKRRRLNAAQRAG